MDSAETNSQRTSEVIRADKQMIRRWVNAGPKEQRQNICWNERTEAKG